jgi:hypothetical protein
MPRCCCCCRDRRGGAAPTPLPHTRTHTASTRQLDAAAAHSRGPLAPACLPRPPAAHGDRSLSLALVTSTRLARSRSPLSSQPALPSAQAWTRDQLASCRSCERATAMAAAGAGGEAAGDGGQRERPAARSDSDQRGRAVGLPRVLRLASPLALCACVCVCHPARSVRHAPRSLRASTRARSAESR